MMLFIKIGIIFEIDKNLKDIYMPIGLITYYTCLSSPFIKFFSNIMGIKINCDNGLEYLEIASNLSYYSWIEANNILSYIYLYIEKDYDKSLEKINVMDALLCLLSFKIVSPIINLLF